MRKAVSAVTFYVYLSLAVTVTINTKLRGKEVDVLTREGSRRLISRFSEVRFVSRGSACGLRVEEMASPKLKVPPQLSPNGHLFSFSLCTAHSRTMICTFFIADRFEIYCWGVLATWEAFF